MTHSEMRPLDRVDPRPEARFSLSGAELLAAGRSSHLPEIIVCELCSP